MPEFTKIITKTDLEVEVVQGTFQAVELTVNENLIDQVITDVTSGALTINLADGSYENASVKARITIPELEEMELNDDTDGSITFDLDQLDLEVNDAAGLQLSGSAQVLNISINDATQIEGFDFSADEVNIEARDASDTEITCVNQLNGSVKQAATVSYKGSPDVQATTSESGSIVDAN